MTDPALDEPKVPDSANLLLSPLFNKKLMDQLIQLNEMHRPLALHLPPPPIMSTLHSPPMSSPAIGSGTNLNCLDVVEKVGLVVRFSLLGYRLVPIRLKVLLERIFAEMADESRVDELLANVGWSRADFARGYCSSIESEREWTSVSIQNELNVLHIVQGILPAHGRLADSLRQSMLSSLVQSGVSPQVSSGTGFPWMSPIPSNGFTHPNPSDITANNNNQQVAEDSESSEDNELSESVDRLSNETAECIAEGDVTTASVDVELVRNGDGDTAIEIGGSRQVNTLDSLSNLHPQFS